MCSMINGYWIPNSIGRSPLILRKKIPDKLLLDDEITSRILAVK